MQAAGPLDIYAGAVKNRFVAAFQAPGLVWTDAELSGMFKLNPAQIGLYREFRAATDKSLDSLAKSDLLRYGGKDLEPLRDMVIGAKDADEAAELLRDYLMLLAGADLARFGSYTIDVVVDGEHKYFGLFESAAESNRMAARMRQEFGEGSLVQGKLSHREFEQFQGIPPESLELFGNMLGLNSTGGDAQDQVFQAYLKLRKSNRSAMKSVDANVRRAMFRNGMADQKQCMGCDWICKKPRWRRRGESHFYTYFNHRFAYPQWSSCGVR